MNSIDKLGKLNAKIAALQAEADVIKTELKEQGPGTYMGKKYRAVVSERISERIDTRAVKALLSPSALATVTHVVISTNLSLYDL